MNIVPFQRDYEDRVDIRNFAFMVFAHTDAPSRPEGAVLNTLLPQNDGRWLTAVRPFF